MMHLLLKSKTSGPGIDPATLNSIFDAFYTTKSQGMGLGLTICRMIVERHGGQVSVLSDGANGALFQVILPARESHGSAAASSRMST